MNAIKFERETISIAGICVGYAGYNRALSERVLEIHLVANCSWRGIEQIIKVQRYLFGITPKLFVGGVEYKPTYKSYGRGKNVVVNNYDADKLIDKLLAEKRIEDARYVLTSCFERIDTIVKKAQRINPTGQYDFIEL